MEDIVTNAIHALTFRSKSLLKMAVKEFNMDNLWKLRLELKKKDNYFIDVRTGFVLFHDSRVEINRKFINFCLDRESSTNWLV